MLTEDKDAIIARQKKALRNYDEGIKRLRSKVYRFDEYKRALLELEYLIVSYWCGKDLDRCAKACPVSDIRLHNKAREIVIKRGICI